MRLYDIPEAAGILGVSTRTAKQYAAQGKIRAQKIGRAWRFTDEALRSFMAGERPAAITWPLTSPCWPSILVNKDKGVMDTPTGSNVK